jgi:AhpD family alkylhydroperoxidase
MAEDALWYEAAQVVGVTNALNVVADASAPAPGLAAVLPPVEEAEAPEAVEATFAGIRTFYARPDVPLPFRIAACDPGYLADLWAAVHRAFADHRLGRRLKEALAFAVSITTRSAFGTAFHGGELRRLGVGDRGIVEVLGVTQMFSSYTKVADTLQLEPDMGHIAPVDPRPAPGAAGPG